MGEICFIMRHNKFDFNDWIQDVGKGFGISVILGVVVVGSSYMRTWKSREADGVFHLVFSFFFSFFFFVDGCN